MLFRSTYTVTVTDGNGCTSSSSKSLTVNQLPSATISGNSLVCSGSSTQWCAPSALSAYLWNTGATSQCVNLSQSGTYTVTVTDGNGCSASGTGQFTFSSAIIINKSIQPVSCNGGSNGSINLSVSGGTPAYNYAWNDGTTTEDRTNLTKGTYTVVVTDANNCSASSSMIIGQPAQLKLNSSKTPVSCNGGSDGTIDLIVTGGTQPYSYLWNDGNTNEDRTGLTSGGYSVTVSDANGCSKTLEIGRAHV